MSTAACVVCGSLRTRKVRGTILQHVVAFLRRQDVVTCDRCGRRGRLPRPLEGSGPARSGRSTATSRGAIDLTSLDQTFDSADSRKGRR